VTLPRAGWAAEAADWERALRRVGSAARAATEKAYLKSDLDFAGAGIPAIRAMVARWSKQRPALQHDQVTGLVAALWARPLHECRAAAVVLLERTSRLLGPADIDLLEHLLRTSGTWALVDGLAINVVGDIVERSPEASTVLDRWAGDVDFWLRRSAILALLRPLRAGGGDFERFARYADAMLDEKEFFVRKAIGWVLREISRHDPAWVAGWTADHLAEMSGVTFREAVRRLPAAEGERLGRLRQRDADLGGLAIGRGRVKEQPP
jgi:3-methyladenine DNA glycosylase AlkD